MLLGAADSFCADTANIWNLVGYVVTIFKIVIPLILIVLGMIDLGKAVVSSDEKAINKAVGTLIKRFVAAVVVFFIPTIVNALFGLIGIVNNDDADYLICVKCVTATCDTEANGAKANVLKATE